MVKFQSLPVAWSVKGNIYTGFFWKRMTASEIVFKKIESAPNDPNMTLTHQSLKFPHGH